MDPLTIAYNTAVDATTLPIAGVLLLSGIIIGLIALKHRRRPNTLDKLETKESVGHAGSRRGPLMVAGCSSGLAAIIWDVSETNTLSIGIVWYQALGLAILLTLTTAAITATLNNGLHPRTLFSTVLLGLSATLASTINIQSDSPPAPCHPGLIVAGYPFPWDHTIYQFSGYRILDVVRCPVYYQPQLSLYPAFYPICPIFFLLDTIFYSATILAILELYRALRMKTMQTFTPKRSLLHSRSMHASLTDASRLERIAPE